MSLPQSGFVTSEQVIVEIPWKVLKLGTVTRYNDSPLVFVQDGNGRPLGTFTEDGKQLDGDRRLHKDAAHFQRYDAEQATRMTIRNLLADATPELLNAIRVLVDPTETPGSKILAAKAAILSK